MARLALALAAGAPLARAQAPGTPAAQEVLLTNVVGHPLSGVPGLPGVVFRPSTNGARRLGPVQGATNGRWALPAEADLASLEDELWLVGGELWLQEGTPAPWDPELLLASLPERVAVNHLGQAAGVPRTTGPTGSHYWALRREVDGSTSVVARSDDLVAGLGLVAAVLRDAVIDDQGAVGYAALELEGVPSGEDAALVFAGAVKARKGVPPAGQAGGALEAWQTFDPGGFGLSPSGDTCLVLGDLTGDPGGDDVLVLSGNVVLQEGSLLPGPPGTAPVDRLWRAELDPGGHWLVRGSNADDSDWVVRDGLPVSWSGQVVSGSLVGEAWDDEGHVPGFFLSTGNSVGDWLVGGHTDHPDPGRDSLLQLNGGQVVVREGDPVDLDGNGVFDDDAYVDRFGTDDGVLDDDRVLTFTPTLRRAGGAKLGQALLRVRLAGTDLGEPTCTSAPNSTGAVAFTKLVGSRSIANDDVTMLAFSLPPGRPAYFLAGVGGNLIPYPAGSQGVLCVTGAAARYNGPGQLVVVGPSGVGACLFHPQAPKPPLPPLAAGDTLHFQCWYRDQNPNPTSNFSSGYRVTFTP